MRHTFGFWLVAVLIGCQPATPTDTVESLVADPQRLKEVQRQCKIDRAAMGEVACNAASEAYRRRFMGQESEKTQANNE